MAVRCFQDLWSVAVGQSAFQDVQLIQKELFDSVDALKKGLEYYKIYSQSELKKLKENEKVHSNLYKFLSQSSKLLNVDPVQLHGLFEHFSSYCFRGSKKRMKQILADPKLSNALLNELSNYYFTERLYLLRTIGQVIGFFQDKTNQYHDIYSKVMKELSDVIATLEEQFEKSLNTKAPPVSLQGLHPSVEDEIESRLALQRVKEQCEILELIFLHYSQYGMKTNKLCYLTNLFLKCGFGREHPFVESLSGELLFPLLDCMNVLQQVILIEGFDMELLQTRSLLEAKCESLFHKKSSTFILEAASNLELFLSPNVFEREDHPLYKNKVDFDNLNSLFYGLVDRPDLSPLILSWSAIRYLLLDEHGGVVTQKMGERAVSCKVWHQIIRLLEHYPFNTKSNVSAMAKKVLRQLLSRVTITFHEETLGDYNDLVSLAVQVLTDSRDSGLHNSGLDALLLSAAGFFPLYVDPMLSILSCMVTTTDDVMRAHAFVANLPIFSEYIATCTRDEVESLEDASVWRLLASKPIRSAGGLHTIQLPVGTIGNLVDSQFGAMVQWQQNVNGWKVLHAELKNLIEYQGPSSNLELLGFLQKTELIYRLVESILVPARFISGHDTSCLAVLETMEVFVSKFHRVIQRVIQSPNPPISLISYCLRCANAWLKINPKQNSKLIFNSLDQIHFLPSSERFGFNLTVLGGGDQPGMYGSQLLKCEKANGCYIVSVATIELLISLLEHALESDASMVGELTASVQFILSEVFACYQQWQKSELESFENLGIRCLELCHLVLTTFADDGKRLPESVLKLQKIVVQVLSCSSVAKVVLKLACIDVLILHAVMANEPSSSAVYRLSETIKLGFSLLNNLLRIESTLIPSNELEERSYLHQTLATPTANNNNNLVSVVASYIYHRHNVALPKLAIALLRRISLVAPMSLYACLGTDVVATRDILLFRLKSRTEDISLKVGILELFIATVQTQPGLLELFLDFKKSKNDQPEHVQHREGLILGESSCLTVVLDMINPKNQGTYRLPPRLHCACVKLINALWVDKRHSTLQAIRSSTPNDGLSFWSSLLYPLFSENSPKDIAQNELLETCAHVFNVIAHEFFFTNKQSRDQALVKLLTEFKDGKRFEHWSKVLLCVTKTMIASPKFDRRRHQMFTSAWRSFLITNDDIDLVLTNKILDDLCSAVAFLVEEVGKCPDAIIVLDLISSLLLILMHDLNKLDSLADAATELKPFLRSIVSSIESIYESSELARVFCHLQTASLVLVQMLIRIEGSIQGNIQVTSDLIGTTCKCLSLQLHNLDMRKSKSTELSLLLVRSLEILFEIDDRYTRDLWLKTLSHESIINLLLSVLVKSFTTSSDGTEMVRLCVAILRLLTTISLNADCARMIHDTGLWSELCLNLMNVCHPTTHKKWIEVYHMCLVLMTRMIVSLSYDFAEEALDFIGVHHERIFECLDAIRWKQTATVLQEAVLSTAFLTTMLRVYLHQWHFKLPRVYDDTRTAILATTHLCVAMLLQPRLLLKTAKLQEKGAVPAKSSPLKISSSIRSISKSQDELLSTPEISQIQERLYFILANCLEFLTNLSPNLCQIMLDQGIDPDEYPQLLSINFSTPSLEQEPVASFGVIISAANLALTSLRKMDSEEEKSSSLGNALNLLSDCAFVLLMSQCLLLLKQPDISNRQKQLLKRELCDELNSCVRSASRHLRHSSSSFSPHSSPIQAASSQLLTTRSSTVGSSKGILELVSAFIKQQMT